MSGGWDVHTHLVPPTVLEAARRGNHGLAIPNGHLIVAGRYRLPVRRLGHPPALLDWIDEQHLAGAVVSVPPALFRYDLTGQAAVDWARLVNDGMADIAGLGAGRLRVLAQLPLSAPALAAQVAKEVLAAGGFGGVALGTLATEASFADPALDRLWTLLDAAGSFVLLHPGASPDPRLTPFYLANLLGNPYETALAAAGLVFGNVLDRFPSIRFCLCHGGGVTAAVAGRWQRGSDTSRPGVGPLLSPPRATLRRFYVDDLVHDPAMLELVESTFGADHILTGSDWPFPMGCDTIDPARAAARATDIERLTRG
jgi:aminocarboxymuconate-semialdehyde decarboxylase